MDTSWFVTCPFIAVSEKSTLLMLWFSARAKAELRFLAANGSVLTWQRACSTSWPLIGVAKLEAVEAFLVPKDPAEVAQGGLVIRRMLKSNHPTGRLLADKRAISSPT